MVAGNLELRLGMKTQYYSGERGERAYELIEGFAHLLERMPEPTPAGYRSWFSHAAREILSEGGRERLRPQPACEVVIDPPHKVILYNANIRRDKRWAATFLEEKGYKLVRVRR